MPILTKNQIVRITDVMLQAGGAPAGHASIVADHLAHANLAGYDMPKAPRSCLIFLPRSPLRGRYGYTVTRKRSCRILGSLISMGSQVGTRTISTRGGPNFPSVACKAATRDMCSRYGRIERGFLSGGKIRQYAPRAIGPGHPCGSHHLGSGRSPLRPIRGP